MTARLTSLLLTLSLSSCGAVELPEEHLYRVADPLPESVEPVAGVLRVEALELPGYLVGDRLMVADGPVRLRQYQYHRWAGSLDQLVGDALRTGLQRSSAFTAVVGPRDIEPPQWLLSGRILAFHQVVEGSDWYAQVTLHLRLVGAADGLVVFDREFAERLVVEDRQPEAVVRALSRGLAAVQRQIVEACRNQ